MFKKIEIWNGKEKKNRLIRAIRRRMQRDLNHFLLSMPIRIKSNRNCVFNFCATTRDDKKSRVDLFECDKSSDEIAFLEQTSGCDCRRRSQHRSNNALFNFVLIIIYIELNSRINTYNNSYINRKFKKIFKNDFSFSQSITKWFVAFPKNVYTTHQINVSLKYKKRKNKLTSIRNNSNPLDTNASRTFALSSKKN